MKIKINTFSENQANPATTCKNSLTALLLALSLFSFLISGCSTRKDNPEEKQKAFEWVFGNLAKPDTAMIRKVLADKPGKRHYVDRDGDGQPEEVWFIDTDPRHQADKRPLLVRAIDEDGDLKMEGEPDFDSDLYLADWKADGTTDAVIDYSDPDGDQDVDQMGIYDYEPENGLVLWWSRDDGDDNLLWYDVDYLYYQRLCQYKTHFGGDESFVAFHIKPGEDHWTPFFENPFLFYDRDDDGVTEEVVRLVAEGDLLRTLRWSFDVDNDGTLEHPRDYDVSISAYAPGWTPEKKQKSNFNFHIGQNQTKTLELRGFPTGPFISRESAVPFIKSVTWARVMMTWDENDVNIAWDEPGNYIERWEGIIAAPSKESGYEFPQIGGPNCGYFNRRFELVLHPSGPNEYYFNPADHRIHLKNSDKTWLIVDYDNDKNPDMRYEWTDTDRDGIMDRISLDADGDGSTDDAWKLDISHTQPVNWTFQSLNKAYTPVLSKEPRKLYFLNKMLAAALNSISAGSGKDAVWDLIENKMQDEHYHDNLPDRFINSDESMLYFLGLAADRRIAKLKKFSSGNTAFWESFNNARYTGDSETLASLVKNEFRLPKPADSYNQWLSGLREKPAVKRVAWDNQWLPPNWGWESEKAAFRCYDGHFDLFGKRVDTLIYPTISNDENYHVDQNTWGMDILHVGETGGCGGLVLYIDDQPFPVRNDHKPGDPVFTAKLIKETPDTVTIEFTATGLGPEKDHIVHIRPSAIGGRKDSPVRVYVTGGKKGENMALGIVLNRLPEENFFLDREAGIMGIWGFQQPEIGWIGTGVIFPAEKFLRLDEQGGEHRAVLKYTRGDTLKYHIQGDWLRGHRFSRCPGKEEWLKTLKETASKVIPDP